MSDEPTPLRLKPRLKSDGTPDTAGASGSPVPTPPAPPASSPSPAPASPESAGATDKIKLVPKLPADTPATSEPSAPAATIPPTAPPADRPRLKPRLSTEPSPQAPAEAPTAPVPTPSVVPPAAVIPPPAVIPAPSVIPAPVAPAIPPAAPTGAGAGEPGRFKLKPKSADAPATMPIVAMAPPTTPPPAPPAVSSEPAPVVPVDAPPPAALKPKLSVAAPPPAPAEAAGAPSGAAIPPVHRKSVSPKFIGGVAAGLVLLAGVAFAVYKIFLQEPPLPPPIVKKAPVVPPVAKVDDPNAAATTEAAGNGATSLPGKMIDKAKGVAGAQTERVNIPSDDDSTPPGKEPAVATKTHTPTKSTGTATIAPGITATASDVVAIDASPAFRKWAANVVITSVFPQRGRATINRRVVQTGQIVDDALGITLERINQEPRELVFVDRDGAKVTRRY